jgi:regulator of nucleoside diphosphate kinase
MKKLILSTDTLPLGMAVAETYSMIQFTGTVELSERGAVVGMFERKRTEYQDIIDQFAANAPADANAIIGVQVSTASHNFKDASYLYLTYVGTPVMLVEA